MYSERYVLYKKSVLLFRRLSVGRLPPTGHFLHRYENSVGNGVIQLRETHDSGGRAWQ